MEYHVDGEPGIADGVIEVEIRPRSAEGARVALGSRRAVLERGKTGDQGNHERID